MAASSSEYMPVCSLSRQQTAVDIVPVLLSTANIAIPEWDIPRF